MRTPKIGVPVRPAASEARRTVSVASHTDQESGALRLSREIDAHRALVAERDDPRLARGATELLRDPLRQVTRAGDAGVVADNDAARAHTDRILHGSTDSNTA